MFTTNDAWSDPEKESAGGRDIMPIRHTYGPVIDFHARLVTTLTKARRGKVAVLQIRLVV